MWVSSQSSVCICSSLQPSINSPVRIFNAVFLWTKNQIKTEIIFFLIFIFISHSHFWGKQMKTSKTWCSNNKIKTSAVAGRSKYCWLLLQYVASSYATDKRHLNSGVRERESKSWLGLPVIHTFIHSTVTKDGINFCRVLVPTVINFLFGRFSFLSSCSVGCFWCCLLFSFFFFTEPRMNVNDNVVQKKK